MTHHPHCPACGSPAPVDADGVVQMHFDFAHDRWCSNRPDAVRPVTTLRSAWRRAHLGNHDETPRRSSYIPLS